MVFAVASLFVVMLTLFVIGVTESRKKVHRFYEEREALNARTDEAATSQPAYNYGPLQAYNFSRSLLALSKVRSLTRDGFQAPSPVESSSSVSVPHAQLKTLDRAL